MLYAHPSALTQMSSDLRPNPWGPELQTLPTGLGLRGSVGLDVPCHAAVGSPYPLKTLFRPSHSGAWRNCRGGYTSSYPITVELELRPKARIPTYRNNTNYST